MRDGYSPIGPAEPGRPPTGGTAAVTPRCGECERTALRCHTLELEAEHRELVIKSLQQKIQNLEERKTGKKKSVAPEYDEGVS